MVYVEFPFDNIVNVHWKKKPDDGGPDGGPGPIICVPEYVHPFVAWFLYAGGDATWLLPHACCQPYYFAGEDDYAQHTVYSGGATTLTLIVNTPGDYMSHHPNLTIAAWIRPQQNPLHFLDPLLWVSLAEPGVVVTYGPAGPPTETAGSSSSLIVTIPLPPHALTPADVPGSPPADPDPVLKGSTMVQFAIWQLDAIYPLHFQPFPDGSTLTVRHDCPPGSIPTPPTAMIGPQPFKRRRTR